MVFFFHFHGIFVADLDLETRFAIFTCPSLSLSVQSCPTTVLILVAHGGSVLDLDMEASVRKADVSTFRGALVRIAAHTHTHTHHMLASLPNQHL